MMGGAGRPTRMNGSAIDALVDRSGRQVRRSQLRVPRIGGLSGGRYADLAARRHDDPVECRAQSSALR